jgi:hypothetical protein
MAAKTASCTFLRERFVFGVIHVACVLRADERFDAARVVLLAGIAVDAEKELRFCFLRDVCACGEAEVAVVFAREDDLQLMAAFIRFIEQRLARDKRHSQRDVLLQHAARARRVVC